MDKYRPIKDCDLTTFLSSLVYLLRYSDIFVFSAHPSAGKLPIFSVYLFWRIRAALLAF
uniref:PIK helical domain-containing protein n=1 Tax=Siphoviridae sp. ctBLh2 TaxID=2827803 RepID=A0A8S5S437_9CAUD|nr:MAG TPA: hypothetical protein [Siphoviridae sp. ctBLh2]